MKSKFNVISVDVQLVEASYADFFLLWLICLSGLTYVDLFQFEGSDPSIDCCQPGHKHVAISINSRVI